MKNLLYFIFYFTLFSCHSKVKESSSTNNITSDSIETNSQNDSTKEGLPIEQNNYFINENISNYDSIQIKSLLDSINTIEEMSDGFNYTEGNVYYSTDNFCKIYSLKGEACGIYCNSFWTSIIEWNFNNKVIRKTIEANDIINIYTLHTKTPHTYLLLSNGEYRSGPFMINDYKANIIKFNQDSIIHLPFNNNENSLIYSNYNVCDIQPVFKFEPSNLILTYKFCNFDPSIDNSDSIIEGEYKYIDESFKRIKYKVYKNN